MPTKRRRKSKPAPATKPPSPARRTDPAVDAFMSALNHPLKPVVQSLRDLILAVSPTIAEGIKWNAPSFRTADYFATVNLRAKGGETRVWLILHTGAKSKNADMKSAGIDAPPGLLQWLAPDRCLVTFDDAADLRKKSPALKRVIRQWISNL